MNLKKQVELAFSTLVQSKLNMNVYFTKMMENGLSKELTGRLYNLILIACGRSILTSSDVSPRLSEHYVVRNSGNVLFSKCPIYTQILKHMKKLNRDTITVIGTCSCEMQSFNDVLNQVQEKIGRPITLEDGELIGKIEIYPPELPC
ncbi:MAG: hypothetical protein JW891_09005 [Candidatus Lokiarchaeota archaeon]|nr:hypothetical protein [Candidatus Lokiarchaeota archaeon]